jgi:hypothetical protein
MAARLMDTREFIDLLFAQYCRTTGGEKTYWRPDGDKIVSVDGDTETVIASGMSEQDAAWITAVHGAFPDLVRCLHTALDEADRADVDRDARETRIAELELQCTKL